MTQRTSKALRAVVPGSREQLRELLALAAAGVIRPRLEPYPLAQLRRAMHRLEDRRVRYRAVIRLADCRDAPYSRLKI